MRIYKYSIHPYNKVELPEGAQILSVGTQQGQPMVWALVDPDKPTVERDFLLVATGEEFEPQGYTYIGAFHNIDGWMVFHLFERI